MINRFAIISIIVGASLCAHADTGSPDYIVTDLGGDAWSQALAVNNHGQIVGQNVLDGGSGYYGFLYSDGVMSNLGTLGGGFSNAAAINDAGQVAGWASTTSNTIDVFLYSGGVMHDTGVQGFPLGLNQSGEICGYYTVPGGVATHGFVYSNNMFRDLGTLEGGNSGAEAINSNGQVVGYSEVGSSTHAFLWSEGKFVDLANFPHDSDLVPLHAYAINDNGQIIGYAATSSADGYRAYLFMNGRVTDLLGTQPGTSFAFAINNLGQILGSVGPNSPGAGRLFLYSDGQLTFIDEFNVLNAKWSFFSADDINDAGQIVGWGLNPQGRSHAYLLTPVPKVEVASAERIRTAKARIRLHGRASGPVVAVRYRASALGNRYHRADGTSSWHFSVRLKRGKNVVSVSAEGRSLPSEEKQITIYRD